jgi:hypothetical protein
MAVARGANGESWDTIVEDEVDGVVLDSEVDYLVYKVTVD